MLVLLGILFLFAIVVVQRVLAFRDRHATHFGWMSERWIAEYRASQQL